jgi:hypothetical protein
VRWSRLGVFNKIFAELARKAGKPSHQPAQNERSSARPPSKLIR